MAHRDVGERHERQRSGRRSTLGRVAIDLIDQASSQAQTHLEGVPVRWLHVQGVAASMAAIAPLIEPNHADELIAAAWMHDIGYAPDLAETGFHPVDGARYAARSGMPELVVSLIAFHTGAEFEAQQRGMAEALDAFTRPPLDMLDILTFADMTTSRTGRPIGANDRLAEILTRYGSADPVHAAISDSAPLLLAAVARVQDRIQKTVARN